MYLRFDERATSILLTDATHVGFACLHESKLILKEQLGQRERKERSKRDQLAVGEAAELAEELREECV